MTQGPYQGGGFVPGGAPGMPMPPPLPPPATGYPYPYPYPQQQPWPPSQPYYGPIGYWPVPPSPPRVWPCFVAVVCVFAGQIAVGMMLAVVMIARSGTAVSSPEDVPRILNDIFAYPPIFLALMGASVLVTLGGGVVPALLSSVPFTRRLAIHRTVTRWWQDVLLVVGCLGVSWLLGALLTLLQLDRDGVLADFDRALRGLRGPLLALAILIIGVIGPIAEELLFRGYVQTRLRERWGSIPAVIVASLLFGILHFDPVHSMFAFGLGLALGWATERSGSIWPAVWAHMLNNTVSVLLSASGLSEAGGEAGAKIFMAVTAAVAVVCIVLVELTRRAAPRAEVIEGTHGTT